MGRTAITISDKTIQQVRLLAAKGLAQAAIAKKLKISARTFERWLTKPDIREAYQQGRAEAEEEEVEELEEVEDPTPNVVELRPKPSATIPPKRLITIDAQASAPSSSPATIPPKPSRGPGRPAIEITAQDKAQIEVMAGLGLTLDQIALALSVSPRTLDNWLQDPEINALYKAGRIKAEATIAQTLFTKARDGNMTALLWYEKTRCGRREKQFDELEAVKVLVESGWIPGSMLQTASTRLKDIKGAIASAFTGKEEEQTVEADSFSYGEDEDE